MTAPLVWSIQPEVFSFSPLPRWYSLIFAAGILSGYAVMRKMLLREGRPLELLDSLLVYVVLGMMIGMRLGHVLFYQPDYYIKHLIEIPMIWKGGYASHGGFLGVIIALLLFVRRHRDVTFLWVTDRVAVISMLVASFIRVGNFFNSEMIGRPAVGLPWAVVFALQDSMPRHPAQLYEAVGYFATFAVAWVLYRGTRITEQTGRLLGVIMTMGFAWRLFCEFFKEDQVPFEAGMTLNMGQILSIPFIVVGLLLACGVHKRLVKAPVPQALP